MNNFFEDIKRVGIIPVIKINDSEKAVPLARALLAGGINAAEITFRSEAAAKSIELMSQIEGLTLCAGTILTVQQAEEAIAAGARAIVSPGTNPEVVEFCIDSGIPVIPGCATPSEVECCMAMGLDTVKLFPAEVVGGVKMLKALAGPYFNMKFMPTGGINPENAAEYLKLKSVVACGGSWIAEEKAIDAGDFDKITQEAKKAAQIVEEIRR